MAIIVQSQQCDVSNEIIPFFSAFSVSTATKRSGRDHIYYTLISVYIHILDTAYAARIIIIESLLNPWATKPHYRLISMQASKHILFARKPNIGDRFDYLPECIFECSLGMILLSKITYIGFL